VTRAALIGCLAVAACAAAPARHAGSTEAPDGDDAAVPAPRDAAAAVIGMDVPRPSPSDAAGLEAAIAADARVEAARAADAAGAAAEPQFYGRWDRKPGRATTVNSGSHLTASFDGTGIAARFDLSANKPGLPTVAWQIDDGTWQEAEVAATLKLADGLPAGRHSLTLMARGMDENQSRWTAPLVASITFLGLDVVGGALLSTPRPARPKIEFLGDSLTEGVQIWGDRPGKTTTPWRTDGRVAWPCQTAMQLGAEWRQVGFGFQGIFHTGNGGVPNARDAFEWVYAGSARDAWVADLVVINQGLNDSAIASAQFRTAFAAFLAQVRKAYPQAQLAVVRPFAGTHAADISAEVDARVAAGDKRVVYIDTAGWLGAGDLNGVHPNVTGSAKIRDRLVPELKKLM
jgi:lysophospholipase L1-like esterase